MSATVETDVLVVGAGPCGVTVANLLGVYGVRAVLIERDTEILDFPRAVGIDDESLRTYQAAGLVQQVLADTIQNSPIRYHTSWGRCFAHVKPSAHPFGWPRRNQFLQPRTKIAGPLHQGPDQAKDGVAIWKEPLARMGKFSIFVGGLSKEAVKLKNDKDEVVLKKDGSPLILYRTLQLNYHINGDEVFPGHDEVNERPEQWVMR